MVYRTAPPTDLPGQPFWRQDNNARHPSSPGRGFSPQFSRVLRVAQGQLWGFLARPSILTPIKPQDAASVQGKIAPENWQIMLPISGLPAPPLSPGYSAEAVQDCPDKFAGGILGFRRFPWLLKREPRGCRVPQRRLTAGPHRNLQRFWFEHKATHQFKSGVRWRSPWRNVPIEL